MIEEEIASLAKEDKPQEAMKLDGFSNDEEQVRGKCKKLGPPCTRGHQ